MIPPFGANAPAPMAFDLATSRRNLRDEPVRLLFSDIFQFMHLPEEPSRGH
jgi:hypothetical protein